MVTKLVIVLSFLGFVCIFFVSPATWWEVVSGFFKFGSLPEGEFNWATLAAFREKFPFTSIICVFQPHQAERLKKLFKDLRRSA
jgi:hypothetical protein